MCVCVCVCVCVRVKKRGGEEGDLGQLPADGLSVEVNDTLAGLPGCSHGLLQLEVVGGGRILTLLACR